MKLPLALVMLVWAATAQAQTIVYGLGGTAFDRAGGVPTASLEYQFAPFREGKRLDTGLMGAVTLYGDHGVHVGFGLHNTFHINDKWAIQSNLTPGLYEDFTDEGDLGGPFEIRSQLGIVRKVSPTTSWSIAVSHISNASTREENPGANTIMFRWHQKM